MNQGLGRRLSLIFDRTTDAGAGAVRSHPGAAAMHPLVDFVAYAEDCTLSGRIRLRADRLTDMLNDHEEVRLVDVMVRSLVQPEAVEVQEVVVPRDELLLVHATGPRGDQARRTRTRQTYVDVAAGPYAVRGYLHSAPFLDAMAGLHRRSAMIPLTDAVIDYPLGGDLYRQRVGTVIVNRSRIDHITEAVEHDGAVGIAPATDDADHAPDFGATILAASGRPSS